MVVRRAVDFTRIDPDDGLAALDGLSFALAECQRKSADQMDDVCPVGIRKEKAQVGVKVDVEGRDTVREKLFFNVFRDGRRLNRHSDGKRPKRRDKRDTCQPVHHVQDPPAEDTSRPYTAPGRPIRICLTNPFPKAIRLDRAGMCGAHRGSRQYRYPSKRVNRPRSGNRRV